MNREQWKAQGNENAQENSNGNGQLEHARKAFYREDAPRDDMNQQRQQYDTAEVQQASNGTPRTSAATRDAERLRSIMERNRAQQNGEKGPGERQLHKSGYQDISPAERVAAAQYLARERKQDSEAASISAGGPSQSGIPLPEIESEEPVQSVYERNNAANGNGVHYNGVEKPRVFGEEDFQLPPVDEHPITPGGRSTPGPITMEGLQKLRQPGAARAQNGKDNGQAPAKTGQQDRHPLRGILSPEDAAASTIAESTVVEDAAADIPGTNIDVDNNGQRNGAEGHAAPYTVTVGGRLPTIKEEEQANKLRFDFPPYEYDSDDTGQSGAMHSRLDMGISVPERRTHPVGIMAVIIAGLGLGIILFAGGGGLLSSIFSNENEGIDRDNPAAVTELQGIGSVEPEDPPPGFGEDITMVTDDPVAAPATAQAVQVASKPQQNAQEINPTEVTAAEIAPEIGQAAVTASLAVTEPAVETPNTAPIQAVPAGKYIVQVRATDDKKEADQLARALRKKGAANVVVSPVKKGGGTLYRVRFGGYGSKESATAAAKKIGYNNVWVIQQ